MVFDSKPSIGMPLLESAFGFAVTLTFDLVTSKSNQFISVLNGTKDVNLVKFWQVFDKILC